MTGKLLIMAIASNFNSRWEVCFTYL